MTDKLHVTPGGLTVMQAKAGIAVAVGFLIFGLVFGGVVAQEGTADGGLGLLMILFMLLWVGVCVAMIVSFARVMSRGGAPADRSLVDVQFGEPPRFQSQPPPRNEGGTQGGDFEVRLRKLEALKRDGLLSESEYRDKREQILREKW